MAFLDISHLDKSFGPTRVVKDFNLAVEQGEFISLLGPSGCGKTTVLRMVGGFETPSSGEIRIDGADITGLRSNQRNIGMVFQSYALFPNLTVAQNVAFGLTVAGVSKGETQERVAEMLALIGLPELGARYPFQLSGGQQQRVALARALAVRPKVLLLDEPLSALDAKIRVSLRREIREIQQRLGITTIFVTHDQEEALSMSDRICIMRSGRIEQVGSPRDLYDRPKNRYVADFVGKSNFFAGRVAAVTGAGCSLMLEGGRQIAGQTTQSLAVGQAAAASLRPEQISLSRAPGQGVSLPVRIVTRIFLGEHTEYLVAHETLGNFLVLVPRQAEASEGGFEPGDAGHASWQDGAALILADD